METAPADPTQEPRTLRKNYLSGFENVAQTLGTMAPAGTLGVVIPLVIGKTGNGTWLLFLAVLGICLLILVNINVFAKRHASAGGPYSFVRLGLGPAGGTVTGWLYVVAMLFGVGSAAPSSAYYAGLVLSQLTGIPDTYLLQSALTLGVIAVSWWTAYRDMKLSSDVMIVIELVSLSVMIAIVGIAMARDGAWVDRPQLELRGAGFPAFSSGLVLCFLTMAGFESATTLGDEAKQAEKTIPRAILSCVVPVGLLYLVMTYFLVGLARKHAIALDQLEAPFDTLARAVRIGPLGTASSVGIALSYFACTLGSFNAGSRALYALAEDGRFPRAFGLAHPRNHTPHRAIALLGLGAAALPFVMAALQVTFVSFIDYASQLSALGYIGAYFMICLAAPRFLAAIGRLRWPWALAALAALLLLAGVIVQSVYPVPPAPECYLPYVFAGVVGLGLLVSHLTRRPAGANA
jgi:amino acid transporter